MNSTTPTEFAKSLRENPVKAYWELHLSDLKARLETVLNPTKKQKIRRGIADAEFRLSEIDYMESLCVGNWVKSQISSKPGKITSLGYAGKIPQAQVEWWGASVPVPERPLNLTLLTDDELVYQWNHDKFPKLVRRFDNFECKDLKVLQEKLEEASYYLEQAKETGDYPKGLASRTPGDRAGGNAPFKAGGNAPFKAGGNAPFKAGGNAPFKAGGNAPFKGACSTPAGACSTPAGACSTPAGACSTPAGACSTPAVDLQQDYQLKINYCSKRISYLSTKNSGQTCKVEISKIKRNGGTQQRITLNHEIVVEYAEAMNRGDRFPPVKLTYDGENYWLTDGFHTTEAAWSIGKLDIEAIVTNGSQREAILASVGVNATHGLRRTNADKRRAVMTVLEDEEWKNWSDREIAKRCKVDHKTVGKIRQDLSSQRGAIDFPSQAERIPRGEFPSDNPRSYIDKYGNQSEMSLKNLGGEFPSDNLVNYSRVLSGKLPTQKPTYNCGDIIRIKSDRSDKRLIGYDKRVAVITKVGSVSVDLKVWGQEIPNVSINDVELLDPDKLPAICFCPSQKDYALALANFDSPEDILKVAMALKRKF